MDNEIHFVCNNTNLKTALNQGAVALDFLRNEQKLTGTKEGCREGDCGACTVLLGSLIDGHVVYKTVNSCLIPLGSLAGKHLVTIEGLNISGLTPVQQLIVDEGGSQCGFCTPGFIVSLTGFLISAETLDYNEAIDYIAGNICRCTGYESIKRAIRILIENISAAIPSTDPADRIANLIKEGFIPPYFIDIPGKLKLLDAGQQPGVEENENFLVGGGTDLYVQKWEQIVRTGITFSDKKGSLIGVMLKDGECFIGASTTISEIMESDIINKLLPSLKNKLKYFGSMQIRNRATVGGNIVNASPIGDFSNILLALNAKVNLSNGQDKRSMPLRNFYTGYKTLDKKDSEILESVSFKLPAADSLFNYEKVSRREFLDIASVNSSIYAEAEDNVIKKIHISAGGVAPYPLYLKKSVEYLTGKELCNLEIKKGIEIALSEISPISDARGSAGYKRLLLRQLLIAHFSKLFPGVISVEEYK